VIYQESFELLSGPGSQGRQTLQLLQPPRTVIVDGLSSLLPKAWNFVFSQVTLSPRDATSDVIASNLGD